MYSKDRDVVSALNEYLKSTKKWRRIGHKFQLPLSYIKPHVEVYSLTVSIWIKDILKETRSDCGVFKNTFQLLPKKNVYRVFLQMSNLAEVHARMNLPGKRSIISKCFQMSNFFRKGYQSMPVVSQAFKTKDGALGSSLILIGFEGRRIRLFEIIKFQNYIRARRARNVVLVL